VSIFGSGIDETVKVSVDDVLSVVEAEEQTRVEAAAEKVRELLEEEAHDKAMEQAYAGRDGAEWETFSFSDDIFDDRGPFVTPQTTIVTSTPTGKDDMVKLRWDMSFAVKRPEKMWGISAC
jgi:hypothetical protein